MRWKDLDFEQRTITVRIELLYHQKTSQLEPLKTDGSYRVIALPAFAVEALQAHKERQEQEKQVLDELWKDMWGLVFTTSHGTPLNERNVTRSFHRMLKRVGMERMRFYDMRHTCASLLLAQEVELRMVMEILGHSQTSLTANIYTHVIHALLEKASNRLDDLLKRSHE